MPATDSKLPKLLTNVPPTPALLAEAVNHYVALGEQQAFIELDKLLVACMNDPNVDNDVRISRIGWICRILYEPKDQSKPLHAPDAAKYSILWWSLQTCSLHPIAQSGSSYFVLQQGTLFEDSHEDRRKYLEYCKQNGRFRKKPVIVPTPEQARKDLSNLLQSFAPQNAKWKFAGNGSLYTTVPSISVEELKKQVDDMGKK